jgi:phosphatidylethanolamine-binding protein (PEBP) family uncharacterized protein
MRRCPTSARRPGALEQAMRGHVLGTAELVGTYAKEANHQGTKDTK